MSSPPRALRCVWLVLFCLSPPPGWHFGGARCRFFFPASLETCCGGRPRLPSRAPGGPPFLGVGLSLGPSPLWGDPVYRAHPAKNGAVRPGSGEATVLYPHNSGPHPDLLCVWIGWSWSWGGRAGHRIIGAKVAPVYHRVLGGYTRACPRRIGRHPLGVTLGGDWLPPSWAQSLCRLPARPRGPVPRGHECRYSCVATNNHFAASPHQNALGPLHPAPSPAATHMVVDACGGWLPVPWLPSFPHFSPPPSLRI